MQQSIVFLDRETLGATLRKPASLTLTRSMS